MKELIKIQERNGVSVVSARELYSFLTNDKECRHFKEWSARNIVNNEYATDGFDYQRIPHNGGNNRAMDDYAISVNFSKELCMMSQCAKGKQARQYFIA
ncbi:MAG: antA/AntB antirepressor family protein [Cytophagaceae bacterium]|jgi:phage anti-repressor protein|nr:antA/AntB antirepressor family protein [Cytophagaceae bacterium]